MEQENKRQYSVFTKPWKTQSISTLAEIVSAFGANAIEYPLREGYQVDLSSPKDGLVSLCKELKKHDIAVTSVAADPSEEHFEACQAAGVPLIRIMKNFSIENGFWSGMDTAKKEIEKLLPLCEQYGVQIGIQHHYGTGIFNSMEMYWLVKDFDPQYVGAIWDAAHSALSGEDPRQGLDIVWDHLCLVNFKTAYYRMNSGPEAIPAVFEPYFTTAHYGNTSWETIVSYLAKRRYQGVFCMPAEYTNIGKTEELFKQDITYLQSLIQKHYSD